MAQLRYLHDGTPDRTFENDGVVIVPGASVTGASSVLVQYNAANPSRIWLVGDRSVLSPPQRLMYVAKFLITGSPDVGFNTGTAVATLGIDAGAVGITLQGNNPVLIGKGENAAGEDEFALVKLPSGLDASVPIWTRLDDVGNAPCFAEDMIRDAAGDLVFVGRLVDSFGTHFAVARVNNSGVLDPSFSGDGRVVTSIGTEIDALAAVAQDAQGRYVVVGSSNVNGDGTSQIAVARYLANGSLDNSFDFDGWRRYTVGNVAAATAVAVMPDGRIVVGGNTTTGPTPSTVLLRLQSNGSPDVTFGNGQYVSEFTSGLYVRSLVVQPDGKIVAGGRTQTGTSPFVVVRYLEGGGLDGSFGTGGVATATFDALGDEARKVALLGDGSIVAAGSCSGGTDFAAARFTSGGLLDGAFDGDGMASWSLVPGTDYGRALTVLADGRIVLAGALAGTITAPEFTVMRASSSGAQDLAFGIGGRGVADVGLGSYDVGKAVAIDDLGRMIVGGESGSLFGAARFVGDVSLVGVPPGGGRGAPGEVVRVGLASGNPFRDWATFAVELSLAVDAPVSFAIHDLRGARVRTLEVGIPREDGPRHVYWDGADDAGRRAPAGVYFARVTAAGESAVAKVVKVE
jgi:uncharacterized delta-60 repeat protein